MLAHGAMVRAEDVRFCVGHNAVDSLEGIEVGRALLGTDHRCVEVVSDVLDGIERWQCSGFDGLG